jgi:hypothetical protein
MKKLVPIPRENLERLKKEKSAQLGYQFVSVWLRDGRYFKQAIESEGCIIQVRGYRSIPFTEVDVELVEVSNKPWNFRPRKENQFNAGPCICGHSRTIHGLTGNWRPADRRFPCARLTCHCKDYAPAPVKEKAGRHQ